MNSLLLLNGSPRGERSNSMKMLAHVAEGWQRGGGAPPEVLHLARRAQFQRAVEAFPTRRYGSARHAALHRRDAGAGEGLY